MFVYVAQKFTATATGKVLKTVTCEKCGTEFHYMLSRIAGGAASAPYYIGQDSARQRAQKRAENSLKKRLKREVELVPCPQCKWVNLQLVAQYRKNQYKPLFYFAMFFLFVGAVIDFIIYISNLENQPPRPLPELAIVAAITAALVVSLLVLQYLLRLTIRPNRHANGNPSVPVGTPPALLKKQDPNSGDQILVPVPSDLSNLQSEARWATFRAGQLSYEPLCCQCLDPSTTTFKFPVDVDKNYLSVPLCHPCSGKLQTQWWIRNVAAVPFALLIGFLISKLVPSIDDTGRAILTVVAGIFLSLVAFVINDRMLRPYRLKSADRSRNIYQIRFQNPAYTALLIRKLGQQDGLY